MQVNVTSILTLPASAALAANLRVKYDATYGLVVAGAEDVELGTIAANHVVAGLGASDVASVVHAKAPGTVKMVAAGSFADRATLYGAANGKVDDIANGNVIGLALQAASGDGSIVEVCRFNQAGTGAGSIAASELAMLDGVTPGTTAAGKVVSTAAGTNKVAEVDITSLKLGGTAVTATAAEVNKLASSGAVVASGTAVVHIADIAIDANGTTIAAAVNAIIAALEAFRIAAAA